MKKFILLDGHVAWPSPDGKPLEFSSFGEAANAADEIIRGCPGTDKIVIAQTLGFVKASRTTAVTLFEDK